MIQIHQVQKELFELQESASSLILLGVFTAQICYGDAYLRLRFITVLSSRLEGSLNKLVEVASNVVVFSNIQTLERLHVSNLTLQFLCLVNSRKSLPVSVIFVIFMSSAS